MIFTNGNAEIVCWGVYPQVTIKNTSVNYLKRLKHLEKDIHWEDSITMQSYCPAHKFLHVFISIHYIYILRSNSQSGSATGWENGLISLTFTHTSFLTFIVYFAWTRSILRSSLLSLSLENCTVAEKLKWVILSFALFYLKKLK